MRCPKCKADIGLERNICFHCTADVRAYHQEPIEKIALRLAVIAIIIAIVPAFWEVAVVGLVIALASFVINIIARKKRRFYRFPIIVTMNLAAVVTLSMWIVFLVKTYPILH